MKDMRTLNRHKMLNVIRLFFSIAGVLLLLSSIMLDIQAKLVGWGLFGLIIANLAWGLNENLDKKPGGLAILSIGILIGILLLAKLI